MPAQCECAGVLASTTKSGKISCRWDAAPDGCAPDPSMGGLDCVGAQALRKKTISKGTFCCKARTNGTCLLAEGDVSPSTPLAETIKSPTRTAWAGFLSFQSLMRPGPTPFTRNLFPKAATSIPILLPGFASTLTQKVPASCSVCGPEEAFCASEFDSMSVGIAVAAFSVSLSSGAQPPRSFVCCCLGDSRAEMAMTDVTVSHSSGAIARLHPSGS
mmetsp:Transcript_61719/g.179023  ORF Transcript_61719/g.179023 Transcript_61719/m.179023 type:complete len:216 (+) Transcript_61719:86-733(+)